MFHSAALKLTGWYLAIIMLLSIGCSLAIYHFASNELDRDNHRQTVFLNNDLAPLDFRNFIDLRTQQLDDSRGRLKNDLLAFNLLVLVGGGGLSYALARRTLEPIEESLEAQKRFAADASHELRTPLTAMQAEIEVALRNPKLSKSEAIALLGSNLEEVEKLRNLSEGLLKLASHNPQHQLDQVVPLKNVIEAATERIAKSAEAKKIKLEISGQNVSVRGGQQSLSDLTVILLDNAIKYSNARTLIHVKYGRSGKEGFISIADHGQGIAAADLPHIFERFYRADSSRAKQGADGYGLGLALAKKIADMSNGAIEVKSAVGKGSTFTLKVPLA